MDNKILYDPTTSFPLTFTSELFKHLILSFSAWYAINDVVGPIKIKPGNAYIKILVQ